MPGISGYDCEGSLTIASVSMNRPAWAVLGDETGQGGLVNLWVVLDRRGEDRPLPLAAGVVPYPRRAAATRHDLRIIVAGDVDETGATEADARIGLEGNLGYLYSNVLAPVTSGDGTRAATLTMPSGATRTASIHVLGLTPVAYAFAADHSWAHFEGTLHISIPGGRFA